MSIDSTSFYFALGDVSVNGETIDFITVPDTVPISSLNSLNEYLITEPFNISDNSNFIYSVQFGLNDSLSALQAVTGSRFINFKVQLIDNNNGSVLGEYDNITYNSENLFQYNNLSYQVNTQGIGNRTVRLKLIVNDNFDVDYSLSQIYADAEVLGKASVKQISYTGGEVVTTYDLAQNYPNPFNPSTTIKFQIPEDGLVTLKIYDILGKEVRTLVNEHKTVGKYELSFDASNLASGVYLYSIKVNDFVSSKKMILLR